MRNIIELLLSELKETECTGKSSKELCTAVAGVIKNEPVEQLAELYECLSALMVALTSRTTALTCEQWDILRDVGTRLMKLVDKLDPELAKKYGLHTTEQCSCTRCEKRREDLHEEDIGKH